MYSVRTQHTRTPISTQILLKNHIDSYTNIHTHIRTKFALPCVAGYLSLFLPRAFFSTLFCLQNLPKNTRTTKKEQSKWKHRFKQFHFSFVCHFVYVLFASHHFEKYIQMMTYKILFVLYDFGDQCASVNIQNLPF